MAEYTKVFENPYPNGWEDLPSENTPITASALQEHTDAIENIEEYLEQNPIGESGTDVQWNQIQESGKKIAEITIDGESQDIFAPSGGGYSSPDLSGTRAEFDAIKDSLPDGSAFDTTDEEVGGQSWEVYDEEERVIGTWFGKPLYRKVFNVSFSTGTDPNTWVGDIPITNNLGTITRVECLDTVNPLYQAMYIPEQCGVNNASSLRFRFRLTNNRTINVLLVEYTKTTD